MTETGLKAATWHRRESLRHGVRAGSRPELNSVI